MHILNNILKFKLNKYMPQYNKIQQEKEGVHYVMPTKKVRSRIGLATTFFFVSLWILSFTWLSLINKLLKLLFSAGGEDWKEALIWTISLSIPLIVVFVFTNRRIHKILSQFPESSNDLFFRKSIRTSITFIVVIFLILVSLKLYNILSILFLEKIGNLVVNIIDLLTIFSFCLIIFLFSWHFQKKTSI